MGQPRREEEWSRGRPTTEAFALAAFGALYASVVAAVVIALLSTDFGRGLADNLEGPVKAMVAGPVLILAFVVFVACLLSLLLPAHRDRLLGIAGVAGWLIPGWLVVAGVVIGSVAYVLSRFR